MSKTQKLTWTAVFVALGILLPMIFHGAGLGRVFLPMHIPVLLSGFFLGGAPGLVVGAVTPLLSSLLTGMPPLMPPVAQLMVWELGVYGLLAGVAYRRLRLGVYPALLLALLGGRLVYGLLGYTILPLFGLTRVPLFVPLTTGLVTGAPGLVVQLVVIPAAVYLVERNLKVTRRGQA
ncbi:MAG: ECF transporter S component [Bacillota bacterium]